jgi:membrane protease YdiL (CAAX protease family)
MSEPRTFVRAGATIAAITATIAVATHYAFQLERAGSNAFWALAVLPTLVFALIALARAHLSGELTTWLRPVWGDFTRGIFTAGLLFAAAYAFSRYCAGTPRESWLARLYLQLGDPKSLREHMGLVAIGVIAAAAGEEIVWRGLVTRLIAERIGDRWAWALAAVPYAAAHLPTVWALRDPEAGLNPILVVAALGAGLVWGLLVRQVGGRLFPAIIAHAAFDWTVVMTFRLWGVSV